MTSNISKILFCKLLHPPVSSVVKTLLLVQEVWGFNPMWSNQTQCRHRLATAAEMGLATSYMLRLNTTSIMNILPATWPSDTTQVPHPT